MRPPVGTWTSARKVSAPSLHLALPRHELPYDGKLCRALRAVVADPVRPGECLERCFAVQWPVFCLLRAP